MAPPRRANVLGRMHASCEVVVQPVLQTGLKGVAAVVAVLCWCSAGQLQVLLQFVSAVHWCALVLQLPERWSLLGCHACLLLQLLQCGGCQVSFYEAQHWLCAW